jgi:mono/diheme cytochrome c family protein
MEIRFNGSALAGLALALAGIAAVAVAAEPKPEPSAIARGKYLVEIGGCNDCHTPRFAMSGGTVPESEWLVGDRVGWQGPWGTTYPPNLRLYMKDMGEAQWVALAKSLKTRPPMPFWALAGMREDDLRALYRYVKSMPVKGGPAPAYLPPGVAARGPVVLFPSPPSRHAANQR